MVWTGMLQGDQKWGAFQSADAFVLPSHPLNIAAEIAADGAGLVAAVSKSITRAIYIALLQRQLAQGSP